MEGSGVFVGPVMTTQLYSSLGDDSAYSGRLWVMGDLKGAGDVGDSE